MIILLQGTHGPGQAASIGAGSKGTQPAGQGTASRAGPAWGVRGSWAPAGSPESSQVSNPLTDEETEARGRELVVHGLAPPGSEGLRHLLRKQRGICPQRPGFKS